MSRPYTYPNPMTDLDYWWENAGMSAVLFYLKWFGPTNFTALADSVGGSYTTVKDRVAELEIRSFVKTEKRTKLPFTKTIYPTEAGLHAAELLNEILIMEESGP